MVALKAKTSFYENVYLLRQPKILNNIMKKNYFKIFVAFHIMFIICICTISTYSNYCTFYNLKKESVLINQMGKLLAPKLVQIYGKLSGCDSGYGFFAPNVRSAGIIILENNNVKYTPEFKNLEARIRFSTFESTISNHLLEQKDTLQTNSTTDSLMRAYNDLLFKAIAVKLINEKACESQTPTISYNIYDYPSLEMFRKGERQPSLQKLYQLELSLNNKNK